MLLPLVSACVCCGLFAAEQKGLVLNERLGVSTWSANSQHLLQFFTNTLSYVCCRVYVCPTRDQVPRTAVLSCLWQHSPHPLPR